MELSQKEFIAEKARRFESEALSMAYDNLSVGQRFEFSHLVMNEGFSPRKASEKVGFLLLENPLGSIILSTDLKEEDGI